MAHPLPTPDGTRSIAHGREAYTMQVGGLTIAIESRSTSLSLAVSESSAAFLGESHAADLHLGVRWGTIDLEPVGTLLFDSGVTWSLYLRGDQYIYRFINPIFGPVPYKEARIDLDFDKGEIILNPKAFLTDAPVDALEYPLDELVFIRMLSSRGGIELHSCGVITPSGKGYVFAGHSGAGKTTTARLWEAVPGASVLSDDRIILRRAHDGTWWMWGTPWHGEAELAVNSRVPLTALMLLERGERNELIEVGPMEALSALLARSFVPFHDEALMTTTIDCLGELAREIPCFRSPFVPDHEFVRFVMERAP